MSDYVRDKIAEYRTAGKLPLGLCPRCLQQNADPIFLGREGEGHICGDCWEDDRHHEDFL